MKIAEEKREVAKEILSYYRKTSNKPSVESLAKSHSLPELKKALRNIKKYVG